MLPCSCLGDAGFFRWASFRVPRSVGGPGTLLWSLVFTVSALSAFRVSDTVCFMASWLATALAATLAGSLTVIGSVANVIVLEIAGARARIGFCAFFRIGAAVTAATLAAGLGLLLAERALGIL
jgi:Na+/H+ antiporter NhaD/arsenite permease-like protein